MGWAVTGYGAYAMTDPAREALESLLTEREGRTNTVYSDTNRVLTVGIGHRVTAADKLDIGDVISDAEVDALFAADTAEALNAARNQAQQAGITDPSFIPPLASVCFQLGCHWTTIFPHTWWLIRQGQFAEAAEVLGGSVWARQTPTRVADFQAALRRLA